MAQNSCHALPVFSRFFSLPNNVLGNLYPIKVYKKAGLSFKLCYVDKLCQER